MLAPAGCTPNGRVIDTVVTLGPGQQAVVTTSQVFSCANVNGVIGQTYMITAVADHQADDAAACAPSQLGGTTCFNALADDDDDDSDNRVSTTAFRVK